MLAQQVPVDYITVSLRRAEHVFTATFYNGD